MIRGPVIWVKNPREILGNDFMTDYRFLFAFSSISDPFIVSRIQLKYFSHARVLNI